MRSFGWLVLALLFLDEVLAAVAVGIGGGHAFGVAGAVLAPVLVVAVWWAFASPKAPYGGRAVRPVVKVLVFGLACWALWAAGHHDAAIALLVFSVIVNAVAQVPSIRDLADESTGRSAPTGARPS